MSTQLFDEETPVAVAPKNGRGSRSVPAPAPTPAPAPEPEISLSDPFDDEPTPEPVVAEVVAAEPEVPASAPVVSAPVAATAPTVAAAGPRVLPDERQSLTLTLKAGGCEGLVIVGLFADGTPGEVLLLLRTAPAATAKALEAFAATLSLALPYGVPAGVLAQQLLALVSDSAAHEAASAIAAALSTRF